MADTLEIFGVEYDNVTGIIAKDDNGNDLTFTRGGGTPTLQTKTYTVDSAGTETITADSGYDGLSSVAVSVASANLWVENDRGTFYTENNERLWKITPTAVVDVGAGDTAGWVSDGYSKSGEFFGTIAVPANTSITPTESSQTVGGASYMMEGAVTVNAISPYYVGSGVPRRTYNDLEVIGAYVSVPAGFYDDGAGVSVASGTAGTPTATKGTVSNHQVSVTPSVTNTTGYITGSTKTGTAVTVTASELASGNKAITQNGTGIDVVGYSTVSVAVSGGVDLPIFTVTDGVATCDKTFAEVQTEGYEAALIKVYVNGQLVTTSVGGYYQATSTSITYVLYESGVPTASITYNSNGTITLGNSAPSVETLSVSSNGTYTADYNKVWNEVVVTVPSGTSKNTQVVQGTTRTTSSTLTAIGAELTVSKTGTYDIYWSAFRSSTSSSYTYGTQLYVDGTAYGTQNTTWSNHVQNNHLTGVSLTANQKIRVYGRNSRGSSYYIYAPTLAIVEA